ncbi:molybdopterin-guanine dinucleotide biosynthesis protein A like protein [Leptolyngbya sp. NIES-3755]|nr:molybdopterin-guanine dinucleotide biosynthesis protein A like protein [Leptolyngbya sp. NIES-3755]
MLKDIVAVKPLEQYQLCLRFEDGVEGIVDISKLVSFTGIFTPLQDLNYFATVAVNSEIGTIVWSCGADLDPDVLYAIVSNQPIPAYESSTIATK